MSYNSLSCKIHALDEGHSAGEELEDQSNVRVNKKQATIQDRHSNAGSDDETIAQDRVEERVEEVHHVKELFQIGDKTKAGFEDHLCYACVQYSYRDVVYSREV